MKKKKEKTFPDSDKSKGPGAGQNEIHSTIKSFCDNESVIPLQKKFPVVCIGASAGGLAALEAFFSAMPTDIDTGMAFIVVQHWHTDRQSILGRLIANYTQMKVFEITDGIIVEPNCIYIIPPNYDLAFMNGTLQLLEPILTRGSHLPIDFVFCSLAQEYRDNAACIVLSGAGMDGTLGAQAVKKEGGLVMAQSIESAENAGMPQSVIAAGLADYALSPAEMPYSLISYFGRKHGTIVKNHAQRNFKEKDSYLKIFLLLRSQVGYDFSHYKKSNIDNRIARRLEINRIEDLDGYVKFLQRDPLEIESLFHDFLIGVTSFFRDPVEFEVLGTTVIPRLFDNKDSEEPVRIWVPGCSTGEEAYSIAMLICEHMWSLKKSFKVQIFATDIDERALETARTRVFPIEIAKDMPQNLLKRYFTIEPDGFSYRITKQIRDILIFSKHSIVKDPPFSRMDLISCRNVLIYLDETLQKTVISQFHYSLNPDGFLFLGTSENVSNFTDLFRIHDSRSKIYIRNERSNTYYHTLRDLKHSAIPGKNTMIDFTQMSDENKLALQKIAERTIFEHFDSSGAIINEKGEILYLYGHPGMFLEIIPGKFDANISNMLNKSLKAELYLALHRSFTCKETVNITGLNVENSGENITVNLCVRQIQKDLNPEQLPNLMLVIFEKVSNADQKHSGKASRIKLQKVSDDENETKILMLLEKLRNTEEYPLYTKEEMETSYEELQSSNEEIQSVRNDLQSANDDLETLKGAMQSANFELSIVNTERKASLTGLSGLKNDINNLLFNYGLCFVFVDYQLKIRWFSSGIGTVINLVQSDIGRHIGDMAPALLTYNRIQQDTQEVLDTMIPKEVEVMNRKENWYLMRISPCFNLENSADGAVIAFLDITENRKMRERAGEIERIYGEVFEHSFPAMSVFEIVSDKNGTPLNFVFTEVNKAFEKQMSLGASEVRGKCLTEVYPDLVGTNFIKICNIVAVTDESASCNQHFELTGRTFSVYIFKICKNKIAVTYNSTDNTKNNEETYSLLGKGILKSQEGV